LSFFIKHTHTHIAHTHTDSQQQVTLNLQKALLVVLHFIDFVVVAAVAAFIFNSDHLFSDS